MGCRLGWDFCILAVIRRWVVCSGGCFLRFHWKGFGGRGSNYRFGKPHQLAIDGTMPANIKKFMGGDLFGVGWGIPGLPLMNSFMKPLHSLSSTGSALQERSTECNGGFQTHDS